MPKTSRRLLTEFTSSLALCVIAAAAFLPTETALAEIPAGATLLPRGTAFFVEVDDVQQLTKEMKGSNVGEMFNDPGLKPIMEDLWGIGKDALKPAEEAIDATVDELLEIMKGKFLFALINRPRSVPAFVMAFDTGDDNEVVINLIERAQQELLGSGADFSTQTVGKHELNIFKVNQDDETEIVQQVVFCERDDTLILSTSATIARRMLLAWDGKKDGEREIRTLDKKEEYNSVMKMASRSRRHVPDIRFYLDPMAVAYVVTTNNPGGRSGLLMAPLIGLNGLKSMAGTVSCDSGEFDWVVNTHVLLEPPRRGIVKALAFESDKRPLPDWIPEDVLSCMTLKWNLKQMKDAIGEVVDLVAGEGTMKNVIANNVSDRRVLKLDDVLNQTTGRMIRFTQADEDDPMAQYSAVAIEVQDREKFEKMFDTVTGKFSDNLKEVTIGDYECHVMNIDFEARFEQRRQRRERTRERIRSEVGAGPQDTGPSDDDEELQAARRRRQPDPTFGMVDDFFVAADNRRIFESLSQTDEDNGLSNAKPYREIRAIISKDLGVEFPAMTTYSDHKAAWKQRLEILEADGVRGWLRRQGENNERVQKALDVLDDNPIPPFETLSKYLNYGGSVVTNEENGIHYTWFIMKPRED